jgi:hypothetical protein
VAVPVFFWAGIVAVVDAVVVKFWREVEEKMFQIQSRKMEVGCGLA